MKNILAVNFFVMGILEFNAEHSGALNFHYIFYRKKIFASFEKCLNCHYFYDDNKSFGEVNLMKG